MKHKSELNELARKIYIESHLTGSFTLRAGQISNEYFDKYLFESDPALLHDISQHLAAKIPSGVQILAGLEMGGIPIATMISHISGLPLIFVRKVAKAYGTFKIAEGIEFKGKNILVIEDVVTSGGQIIKSVNVLRQQGGIIKNVHCVIDRESNGKENLSKENLQLTSLFTMTELKNAVND